MNESTQGTQDVPQSDLIQPAANDNMLGPRRLRIIWFKDIEPDLTRRSLVAGLLDHGALSVLYGASHQGKTFIVLDMALHIALGWAWHGYNVDQGDVVYIAAEGGRSLEKRVEAFRQHHDLAGKHVPFGLIPCTVDLLNPHADTKLFLAEIVSCAAKPKLIVVDTLSRAMPGGDENGPKDMTALLSNIDRIRQETQAHVLLVHHTGKNEEKGARGHSSLRAAIDTEIEVRCYKGCPRLKVTKQRDGESTTTSFKLRQVEIGKDADGHPVTSCVVEPSDGITEKAKLTPQAQTALEVLKALGEATRAQWRDACHGKLSGKDAKSDAEPRAFNRALERLLKGGMVVEDDEGHFVPTST